MLKSVQELAQRQAWDLSRQPTLLAISGGLDSLALAAAFRALNWPCQWAHVNFQLRGEESDQDEAFVRHWAEKWGVELHVERCQTADFARQNGLSIQEAARHLRYAFFDRIRQQQSLGLLATAHHSDDNFEHFFLYVWRGSVATALRGLPLEGPGLVRPLWTCTRDQIREFALQQGLSWREDSSNARDAYRRNRIRHQLIEPWAARDAAGLDQLRAAFSELALRAQEQDRNQWLDWESELGENWERRAGEAGAYLAEIPAPRLLQRLGFNAAQIQEMGRAERSGARWQGRGNWQLLKLQQGWLLAGPDRPVPEPLDIKPGETRDWGLFRVSLSLEVYGKAERSEAWYFAAAEGLRLRSWHAGDKFQPWGMKGQKKVSDLMAEKAVPLRDRSQYALVEWKQELAGVLDLRRAQVGEAIPGEIALVLRWERLTTFV
jgi:tRNA(Ile)-lysidine synthase